MDEKERIMKKTLHFLLLLTVAILIGGPSVQAQIEGTMEVHVPFPFYVSGVRLPAGKYILHQEDLDGSGMMEITNASKDTSALFLTMPARSASPPPDNELIFDHYQNRNFLAKIFDMGDKYGAVTTDSGYSKMYHAGNEHGDERHVPAIHHAE